MTNDRPTLALARRPIVSGVNLAGILGDAWLIQKASYGWCVGRG